MNPWPAFSPGCRKTLKLGDAGKGSAAAVGRGPALGRRERVIAGTLAVKWV